jgi:hypothetical protein
VDVPLLESWLYQKDKSGVEHPFTNQIGPDSMGVVAGEICMRELQITEGGEAERLYKKQRREDLPSYLLRCFSNLNGMPISHTHWQTLSKEERQAYIHSKYPVAGIVGTTREWSEVKQMGRTDFANQIGGVYGIINTGKKNIYAGQLVMAVAPLDYLVDGSKPKPRQRITGTESEKILLDTVPYDPQNVVSPSAIKNVVAKALQPNGVWPRPGDKDSNAYLVQNLVEDLMLFAMHVNAVVEAEKAATAAAGGGAAGGAAAGAAGGAAGGAAPNGINMAAYNANMAKELTGATDDALFRLILDPASLRGMVPTGAFDEAMVQQTQSLMPRLMNSYFRIMRAANDRIIGVALTDAPPGSQFDIKQGSQIA